MEEAEEQKEEQKEEEMEEEEGEGRAKEKEDPGWRKVWKIEMGPYLTNEKKLMNLVMKKKKK